MKKLALTLLLFAISFSASALSPLHTQVTKECLGKAAVPQAQCVFEILTNKFPQKGQTELRQIVDGATASEIQTLISELARELKPFDEEKVCADLIGTTGNVHATCIEYYREESAQKMRIHSYLQDLWASAKSHNQSKRRLSDYTSAKIKELSEKNPATTHKQSAEASVPPVAPASK